jgi:hypothetical protein
MKIQAFILSAFLALTATAALAHGGEEHVMGTVTNVTPSAITVKTTAKTPVTVVVAPTTKFIRNKAAAKIGDLNVGDRVVIHAIEGADKGLTADTVEFSAGSKAGQARPAAAQTSKAKN